MTGPEREDFRALREEMRDGLHDIKSALLDLNTRVHNLELLRAADEAVRDTGKKYAQREQAERRWRTGLAIGIGTSIVASILNFIFERGHAV